jgi:hypothetical protein
MPEPLDRLAVRMLVEASLPPLDFHNFHGITGENVGAFLVEPYQVLVDPDDGLGSPTEPMWIVLEQHPGDALRGYCGAYGAHDDGYDWAIVEHQGAGWVCIVGGETFANALKHM